MKIPRILAASEALCLELEGDFSKKFVKNTSSKINALHQRKTFYHFGTSCLEIGMATIPQINLDQC
jgi:hypothetical protein